MNSSLKRLLSLILCVMMVVGMLPMTAFAEGEVIISNDTTEIYPANEIPEEGGEEQVAPIANEPVAKVGNTEYTTIDAAIAAWTNGSTLTLLADVTLSDVIMLKSTEHHILNLGTYTMTAASGKNAIEIVATAPGTGDGEHTAITIKADAANPGCLNAGSKTIIYYDYSKGTATGNDRPIIKIEGGVFTGSTSSWGTAGIYTIGTAARKCATLNISGGTFNCSINGSSKSKLLISGGTFNYSVGSQGDSTALRLISGGKFKTLGFMTADSNNTKFWFGTSMGNSNVGLYVDSEGYLVVGGPVITELSEKYPAKASNYNKWSSYLKYSSAATYGLFYEDADMAIAKHGAANVTIWVKPTLEFKVAENVTGDATVVEEIDSTTIYENYIVKNLPEDAILEIVLKSVGDKIVYEVAPMANGVKVGLTEAITFCLPIPARVTDTHARVYHDGTLMGIYEIKGEGNAKYVEISSADFSEFAVEPTTMVAKIGTTEYETLAAAIAAAQDGDTIVIIKDISDEAITADKSLTITGDATLTDVSINGTAGKLTVSNLTFKGNSWINAGGCDELVVNNVTADVTPSNANYTNSRSAFIGLGKSEAKQLKLTVTDCNVIVPSGTDAVLGWAAVTEVTISGNTFGSETSYQNGGDIVKFMAITNGAVLNITNNTSYSNYNGFVFAQNTTRDNAYTVYASGNTFYGGADHIWIEISGGDTVNAKIEATSDNTVNGKAFTAADIKYHNGVIKNWNGYAGVDVTKDSEGKLTGGSFLLAPSEDTLADGFKANKNADGTYGVVAVAYVAEVNGDKYETLEEAIAAAEAGHTIKLLSDIEYINIASTANNTTSIYIPAGKQFTLDLNGHTISGENNVNGNFAFVTICSGADVTIDDTSVAKTGKITYKSTRTTANENQEGYTIRNQGNLTLNGGTVENATELASNGYEKCVTVAINNGVSAGKAATFTMNGGVVVSDTYFAIRSNVYAENTIVADTATVAINGGTVYGLHFCDWGTANLKYDVIIGDNAVVECGNYPDYPGQSLRLVNAAKETTVVSIKIAEGAQIKGDTYSAGTRAKIGNACYTKLSAAIAALKDGDTLVILSYTITDGAIKLPANLKNVTIKGSEGTVLKDMTISAADGNSYSYVGLTFDGIVFDNSRLVFTGWRNGDETIKDLTITNCVFKNLNDDTNTAPVHINKDAAEAVEGFTFTNNVIDGATGGQKSGIYLQATGNVVINNNVINNVSFRPFVVQITTDDGIADSFAVTGNTFSGSAVGRAQGLGSNGEGTDTVELVVSGNIFKGITDSQQICYWNFNAETTTADLSKNYYDIDIVANPSRIYFNGAASDVEDLIEKGVYPYYAELNDDGTINTDSLVGAPTFVASVNGVKYETIQAAINAAEDGDVVTILPGEYSGFNISNKNITIQGTVGDNGELLTTIKGGNPAITGHGFNGTIKDLKIVDAFKVMYAEPAGNVTVDNVYVTGATYGFHLVAYSTGLTWTIQNSYMDLSWANSFGVYGDGDAAIVVKNNKFASTSPYYPDYGALAVNTFLPNVTVTGNVFGENVKIFIDDSVTDTSNINISKNYHADGVDKAFAVDEDGGKTVAIYEYYKDEALTELVDTRPVKIGNTYYATLAEAIAAAEDGAVVELVADVSASEVMWIGKSVTINGNGHKITSTATRIFRLIASDIDVTFNNVNLVSDAVRAPGIDSIRGISIDSGFTGIELTLNNCTVDFTDASAIDCSYAVNVVGGSGYTVTVNGGTYEGANVINVWGTNHTITVKNATLNSIYMDSELYVGCCFRVEQDNVTVIAEGNTYNGRNAVAYSFVKEVALTASNNTDNTTKVVAKIGNTYYTSLADAFAATNDDDTITLINSIELDAGIVNTKNVTLDLNGKTLSQSKACTESYEMILNKGDLTITDTVGGGKISFTDTGAGDPNFGWGSYTIRNEGNLVVENGTIEFKGNQAFGTHCSLAIFQYSGSTTINGGKIVNNAYRSVRLWKGDMTINGGTFEGQVWVQCVDDSAKLTINGGTFAPATSGDASSVFVSNASYDVELAVTNGTFNGKIGCSDATKLAGAISGGKFNAAAVDGTNEALIAQGLIFGEADDNGYTSIVDDPATHYIYNVEDLKAFRDAVNAGNGYAGQTVYLNADIDLAGVDWSVNIGDDCNATFDGIFDGQNHTISNLTSTETAQKSDGYICTGLFGAIYGDAVIKNLTIKNATISTGEYTGSNIGVVVGFAYSATGSIENVKVVGDIKIDAPNASAVGAIVGYLYYGDLAIVDCTVEANEGSYIKASSELGGIIGYGASAQISNCSVSGLDLTAKGLVGGIAGLLFGDATVGGCSVNDVNVFATGANWINSVAIAVGTIAGNGTTVSNVTYSNVNAERLVGSTYAEKPTSEVPAVQAKIGDKYYTTLQAAIDAANGNTVTLLAPIIVAKGETLEIDLKGQTVSVVITEQLAKSFAMITNKGTLTINDSVGGGKLSLNYTANSFGYGKGLYTISNEGGTLVINGGRIENLTTVSGSMYDAIDNNSTLGNTYLTINGGEIYCGYLGIRQFANSTTYENLVTVNGGTVEGGNSAIWIQNPGSNQPKADVVVTGGDIVNRILAGESEGFGVAISGGTFTVAVAEEFCADGYIPTANADGTYGVKLGKFVARNTTTGVGYETLAEAIKAAQAGETVTVFAGTYAMPSMKAGITIEGEGEVLFEGTLTGTLENLTLKNIHIKGGNAQRWAYAKGDLVFENVTFEATGVYALHFDGITAGATLLYKDCTIIGWAAMSGSPASCVFDGCTFKGNGTYGLIRTYFDATIENCTFDVANVNTTDIYQDGIHAVSGAKVTVDNCTNVNGDMKDIVNIDASSVVVLDGVTIKNVAKIGDNYYRTITEAIKAAKDGDVVTILPGEYSGFNISNKNITIQGTVGDNGELLTTIKGGNPAITGHNFNGTIKDLKIVDAFKVMYAEPAGNVTVDNVYVTGATYGFHLVAYSTDLTWTIQNSYMDLSWANSFGVYGGGDAAIVIKGNKFVSTNPYYPDYGALHVNSFLPNVTVQENIFGENAKIMIRDSITDTSKINISKNYHADGVANAFVDDSVKIGISKYYTAVDENGNLTGLVECVAMIGNTCYATLAEAFAAAQDGDAINLLANIAVNESITNTKKVTLDLNGKTITGTDNGTASFGLITNKGTLTITGNGTITLVATNNRGWNTYSSVISNTVGGKLIVENGTIEHLGGTDMAYGIDNLTNGKGTYAETVINGGTVKSTYRAIRQFLNGVEAQNILTVNGGTIEGANKAIWMQDPSKNANTGTLTVGENAVIKGNIYLFVTAGSTEWPVEVAIATAALKNGSSVVTGNVPAGYITGETNGIYGVSKDATKLYIYTLADLKAFRDAVNSGENYYQGVTVYLAANIDLAGENWVAIGSAYADHGFMGNFDGNGFKIKNLTITNPAVDADGYAYAGFFGVTEGIDKDHQNYIKNLVIENVTIETSGHIVAAAIAYPYYTALENITVCGDIAIKGGDYTAGALAYTRRCVDAKNVTVSGNAGSYITGAKTVGGVISDIQTNGGLTANYSNFSASGLTITGDKSVGGISGIIAKQTLDGATVKNVTLVCSDARVGIVAGSLGGTSTIKNIDTENITGASNIVGAAYDSGYVVVNNGDVYTAVEPVATINGVGYATLEAAIKAAKAGDTVTVFAGTYTMPSMKAGITIVGEGNVVFEGTLSGTLENLTLKNIHIKGGNAQRWAYAKGDLVFENVTFEATGVYALHFDGITAGATLSYKNCTIIGWAAMSGSPASCVFDGCTFKGNGTYGLIRTYFDATIENCTFDVANVNTTDIYQDGIHAVSGAKVTVDNCTNANGDMKDIVNIHANSVVVLDGEIIKNVAKIGDNYYRTITEAINAAADGATVEIFAGEFDEAINVAKLEKNITIKGTPKYTIEGEEDFGTILTGGIVIGVDNNVNDIGSITIQGISFTGKGVSISDLASVNISGNKFSDITAMAAIYVQADNYTENVTISGNEITNVNGTGIRVRSAKNITIDSNTVAGTKDNSITLESALAANNGTVVITNNKLSDWANNDSNEGRAIRISNGSGDAVKTITVESNVMLKDADATEEYVKITGATPTVSIDKNYWDGKIPNESGIVNAPAQANNYYTDKDLTNLVEITYAAEVNGTKYETLDAAIAAAKNGDTVKLMADCAEDMVIVRGGVTLDLNGYTLTADYVHAFNGNNIVDNSATKSGLLVVDDSSFALAKNNAQMPVYSTADGGYKFATMKMTNVIASERSSDSFEIIHRPRFGVLESIVANSAKHANIEILVRINWPTEYNTVGNLEFVYNDDFVGDAYTNNKAFNIIVSGLNTDSYKNLTAVVVVRSTTTNVEIATEIAYTYNGNNN